MANTDIHNIFAGMKKPRDVTKYALMRGVTDFSKLEMFNLYETGYSFLIVTEVPKFLLELCKMNVEYDAMIKSYIHILEYEFRGLEGIGDITTDSNTITNGVTNLDLITKVNMDSNVKIQMQYFEKAGSTITKVHELFLRGIKDPRTQVKRYNGLLDKKMNNGVSIMNEAGFEYETFSFLYFVTDNTCREIEKAYYFTSAQPTNADTSIYNSTKGDIAFKEITCEFNAFPITGVAITQKAQLFLDWINENTTFIDAYYQYDAITRMPAPSGIATAN